MKKKFKRIYIEITNVCNRSCSFCSKGTKSKKSMTLEEFEHVLKEIDPYTDYVYLHVKGEPLLHCNFKEILDLCKKYNKKVNLTTNGTLLYTRVKDIVDTKVVRQINISLHNFKENESYIESVLEATTWLLKTSPIHINYRFWTLQNNQLTPTMEKMLRRILDYYHLDQLDLSLIRQGHNIKLMGHLYLNKGDLFYWPSLTLPLVSTTGTCLGTRDHLGILSDGTVIPCCLDSDGIISLGNIFNQSFPKILESELYQKINHGFLNQKIVCELCQRCSYRKRFDHS